MRAGRRAAARFHGYGDGVLVLLLPLPAYAHNNRAVLAFHGGFGATAARCQRVIAKATEACSDATAQALQFNNLQDALLDARAACDATAGAGDGFRDACPLTGGVATEDEMFVLLGSHFKPCR